MKKTNVTLILLLILFLAQANAKQVVFPVQPFPVTTSCYDGGIVIFTEGLTEDPIEMEFEHQSSRSAFQVEVRIYNAANQLIYTDVLSNRYIQINSFKADPGQYLLEIELNGETQSVVFYH